MDITMLDALKLKSSLGYKLSPTRPSHLIRIQQTSLDGFDDF